MNAILKALDRSRSVYNTAYMEVVHFKQAGFELSPSSFANVQYDQYKNQAANQQKYRHYRGWVYAAINALASAGMQQPFRTGRKADGKAKPKSRKHLPSSLQSKAVDEELELLPKHYILKHLDKPNPIQSRQDFIYTFIANLCLTGWGFVVGEETKEGPRFYALPTGWVTPVHTKGMFAEFKIANPYDPSQKDNKPIPASQVGWTKLPDPANPFAGIAPASAQNSAIAIDENIQTSQQTFFKKVVSPSAIVTVGKNPHPDVPGGVRPRLTAVQRRQVFAAIEKTMQGVENYGQPAIVDGMIEKIERLSASQNEIGWEKSEKTVRTRILSAFSVHPFILAEPMNVGGWSQAEVIYDLFYDRVNIYLDLLSGVMTHFVGPFEGLEDDLLIWVEQLKSINPERRSRELAEAAKNGFISENEYRSALGFAPAEDGQEAVLNPQSATIVETIAKDAKAGTIEVDQAIAILMQMGIPENEAKDIAGDGPDAQPSIGGLLPGIGNPLAQGKLPPIKPSTKPQTEDEQLGQAVKRFEQAMLVIGQSPDELTEQIMQIVS